MMISRGKGKSSLVPCTCSTRIRRAMRMGLSFFSISSSRCTQKAELASTRMLGSFPLPFSSAGSWLRSTFIRTPSASGFSGSLPITFTSNEKLMFDRFLKGIFIVPLLGIFIIFVPDFRSSRHFRQITCGTSPRLWIGTTSGLSSSTCSCSVPEMSVDTSSSGMLARTRMLIGSPSRSGTSIACCSSPFSTALTEKIFSRLQCSLPGKGWTSTLSLRRWNSRRWASAKQSRSSAWRASCLQEEAKMGYLVKLTLFLSSLRHSEVWRRVKLRGGAFSLLLSFIRYCNDLTYLIAGLSNSWPILQLTYLIADLSQS